MASNDYNFPEPMDTTPVPSYSNLSNFEQVLRKGHEFNEDPFANFSYTPPKPAGRYRHFIRKQKFKSMGSSSQSRDKMGSNSSIASMGLSGSTQNLLDPAKMMTMQEDARSRRISAEVMKHRLYESVVTSPRRRRFSMRMDYYGNTPECEVKNFSRMVQSVPVTPAHSEAVTPAQSPTGEKKFLFGFFSRGTTPRGHTPDDELNCSIEEVEENRGSTTGLASLFQPQPRCILAHPSAEDAGNAAALGYENNGCNDLDTVENRLKYGQGFGGQPRFFRQREDDVFLQDLPKPKPKRHRPSPETSPVCDRDVNAVAPTSY